MISAANKRNIPVKPRRERHAPWVMGEARTAPLSPTRITARSFDELALQSPLPTDKEFRAIAGEPKPDSTRCCCLTHHNSINYKLVLQDLADLQRAWPDPSTTTAALVKGLGELRTHIDAYLGQTRHPRAPAMHALLTEVQQQRAKLTLRADSKHEAQTCTQHAEQLAFARPYQPEALEAYERRGLTRPAAALCQEAGIASEISVLINAERITGDQLCRVLEIQRQGKLPLTQVAGDRLRDLLALNRPFAQLMLQIEDFYRHGGSTDELMRFVAASKKLIGQVDAVATVTSASVARAAGMSPEHLRDFTRLNIPLNPHTVIAPSGAGLHEFESMGDGALSNAHRARNRLGDEVVTKHVDGSASGMGYAAHVAGICTIRQLARVPNRQISAYHVSQYLKFGLVPKTGMAYTKDGELTTSQVKVKARSLQYLRPEQLAQPLVRQTLTRLQFFDALIGEPDRHCKNFIFEMADDKETVKAVWAIDNDQCFGKFLKHPEDIAQYSLAADGQSYVESAAMNGCLLPTVIDRQCATTLRAVTREELRAAIGEKMLDEEEFDAMFLRLDIIKLHVTTLIAARRVVERLEDWGAQNIEALMGDRYRSYALRSVADLGALQGSREGKHQ